MCRRSAACGGLSVPIAVGAVSRTPSLTVVINRSSWFPPGSEWTSTAGHSLCTREVLQLVKAPLLEAGCKGGWAASLVGCGFKDSFIHSLYKLVLVPHVFPWVLILYQKPTALPCQCVLGNVFLLLEAVREACWCRDAVWTFIRDGDCISKSQQLWQLE